MAKVNSYVGFNAGKAEVMQLECGASCLSLYAKLHHPPLLT